MKKCLLGLSLFIGLQSQAQNWVYDTISLGAGATNDVYYSMANGIVKTENNANWYFGLSTAPQTAGVFINHIAGVRVFNIHKDTSAFNAVGFADTMNATLMFNPDTSWTVGALNTNKGTNPFDFGWGKYASGPTYNVYGDSVFIINAGSNFYKVVITEMTDTNDYKFKVGVLGLPFPASNFTFTKAPKFSSSNLIYITSGGQTNPLKDTAREPANATWDINFTNYMAWENNQPYYPVVGALHNSGVQAAKITGTAKNNVPNVYNSSLLKKPINTIGYNWKVLNGGVYDVDSMTSYVVKAKDGIEYQIAFNYYSGKSQGKIGFGHRVLGVPFSIVDASESITSYGLYPNPALANAILTINSKQTQNSNIIITDLTGKVVYSTEMSLNNGLNAITIPTESWMSGTYYLQAQGDNFTFVSKIVKQ
jgi:hypothetical protein